MEDKKKKYNEFLKQKNCCETKIFLNVSAETDNDDVENIFYTNVDVAFWFDKREYPKYFYPGVRPGLDLFAIRKEGKFFMRKDLPTYVVEWIEEHLYKNIPKK